MYKLRNQVERLFRRINMKVLERLPRENGRDYALRVIKDNIIHLNLEPGSQVSENELSAELGLSRTPVREALIELSKVKIIEIQPQKRSVVRLIDYDLVEESRFMRNILECGVVELLCEMRGPEDVERLRKNVRLQKFSLKGKTALVTAGLLCRTAVRGRRFYHTRQGASPS